MNAGKRYKYVLKPHLKRLNKEEDFFTRPGVKFWEMGEHWKKLLVRSAEFDVWDNENECIVPPATGTLNELAEKYGNECFPNMADPVMFFKCAYLLNGMVANHRPASHWFKSEYGGFNKGSWIKRARTSLENVAFLLGYFYMEKSWGLQIRGRQNLHAYLLAMRADVATIYGDDYEVPAEVNIERADDDDADDDDDDKESLEHFLARTLGMTLEERNTRCQSHKEWMDYCQDKIKVVDSHHGLTKWTFSRKKLMNKNISGVRDEVYRKSEKGIFSNCGLLQYEGNSEMKDGSTACRFVGGHYLNTAILWDQTTVWLREKGNQPVDTLMDDKSYQNNSLSKTEWEIWHKSARKGSWLCTAASRALDYNLSKARDKLKKDTNRAMRASNAGTKKAPPASTAQNESDEDEKKKSPEKRAGNQNAGKRKASTRIKEAEKKKTTEKIATKKKPPPAAQKTADTKKAGAARNGSVAKKRHRKNESWNTTEDDEEPAQNGSVAKKGRKEPDSRDA